MKYSISALSRKTGLSIHTLRFYEKEGLLRYVERTASGRRMYGEDSLGCLLGVLALKQAGMTLPQIKAFFDETTQGAASLPVRLQMMLECRQQLEDNMENLRQGMKLVDYFINGTKKAIDAMAEGKDPDKMFPYITRAGIANFPFQRDDEGRLEPDIDAKIGK